MGYKYVHILMGVEVVSKGEKCAELKYVFLKCHNQEECGINWGNMLAPLLFDNFPIRSL